MKYHGKFLSSTLIAVGALGLLLSFLGKYSDLGNYKSAVPRSWEMFDQQLVNDTPDFNSLQKKLVFLTNQPTNQLMSEQEKMLIAYNLVANRFTHTDQAKYTVFSNWVLWLMGKVYSPFSYIRDPEILVAKGYSSLCSEQAYLLQTLAESVGIRTRSVGLNGHVVMEAWYENDWHLFDPNLELVPLLDNKRILSLDELARSPGLIRQFYAGHGDNESVESFVNIIATREDNSFMLYWMVTKGLTYRIESLANTIKWILPSLLLLLGFGVYFKTKRAV